jgi:hypothetical protein
MVSNATVMAISVRQPLPSRLDSPRRFDLERNSEGQISLCNYNRSEARRKCVLSTFAERICDLRSFWNPFPLHQASADIAPGASSHEALNQKAIE